MSVPMPPLILAFFVAAAVAPWMVHRVGRWSGWLVAAVPLLAGLLLATRLGRVESGGDVREVWGWVPALGVDLSFRIDGLSLLFALLISGVGTLIAIYAGGYLRGDRQLGRFYLLFLVFAGAMLGAVLADNLIVLFVFWELTSIASYFLVGYKHEQENARGSALQALLVTGSGGLAMLAGFLLLGSATGTLRISELLVGGEQLAASGLEVPALILILLGAFTKSAQFPFHFWLPNAMAAPTPVSAFLHSATMVKLGIYLLARLQPLFGGSDAWLWLLGVAGAVTLATAALLALRQSDLKRLLAYSTLAALGILTLLLAVGTPTAVKAAVVFLLAHSLYKASLFMVAGNVDFAAGSRDVRQLAGLGRAMPISFAAAVIAGLSTAGLPPKLGFIGKEFAYEALLGIPPLLIVAVAGNAVMVGVAALVAAKPFLGRPASTPKSPHEVPLSMWLSPAILAALGLLFGLLPGLIEGALVRPAVGAILGRPSSAEVYLWAGFTPALALSALTVGLGALLLLAWQRVGQGLTRIAPRLDWGPAWAYQRALLGMQRFAAWTARLVQSDDLRRQLLVVLGVTVALVGAVGIARGALGTRVWPPASPLPGEPILWVVAALIVSATVAVVLARSRLAAVTALGVVGFGMALLFVLYSAPDLAITQFLVETLIVVVMVLVMIRLPDFGPGERLAGATRARDAVLAVTGGGVMAALTLAVVAGPLDMDLTRYFESESVPGGFGRNIVNVILVDFRALDTLGEITVLMVAAVGVWALLKRAVGRGRRVEPGGEEDSS